MAQYCTQCGTALGGDFCSNCGARAAEPPVLATGFTPTAPGKSKSSPVAKIVFIVLAVFVFFGAIGAAGLLYVGYKAKQKITQVAREAGMDLEESHSAAPQKQVADGCFHLSAEEGGVLLGIRIVRTEPRAPEGCVYFGDPKETAEHNEGRAGEGFRELQAKGDASLQDAQRALEKITHGIVGSASAEGMIFGFTADRNDAKSKWAGFKLASKLMGGMSGGAEVEKGGAKLFEPVSGLGEEAMFTPLGATLHVIQNGVYLELDFRGAPADRERKCEIARKIAATL